MRSLHIVFLAALAALVARAPAQITESTSTVAPGRFLIEMDALSVTFDRDGGDRYRAIGVASTFLTTGLATNWDLQVGAELFLNQKYESGSFTDRNSGIGDMYVRTKWRFYEDEGSGTAIALLPYVKIPTNSGGVGTTALEGGLIVPWSTTLAGGLNVEAMAGIDFLRNDADDGYDSYWHASMTVNRPVAKRIAVYGELVAAKSSGGAPWDGSMGVGLTLAASDMFQWDVAVYRGVSSGAADWNPVVRLNIGF